MMFWMLRKMLICNLVVWSLSLDTQPAMLWSSTTDCAGTLCIEIWSLRMWWWIHEEPWFAQSNKGGGNQSRQTSNCIPDLESDYIHILSCELKPRTQWAGRWRRWKRFLPEATSNSLTLESQKGWMRTWKLHDASLPALTLLNTIWEGSFLLMP